MNNGKYDTKQYKQKQAEKLDRLFGELVSHTKSCIVCGKNFTFTDRIKTKRYKEKKYCSRSCANNRQEWWKNKATHYRTIAFQNHDKACVICGFDKIVTVHHIDENKKNNKPENLIPLCPNHHEMIHCNKWKKEVQPIIDKWQKEFRGIGEVGSH